MTYTLQLRWPVTDPTVPGDDLIAQAAEQAPWMVVQHEAELIEPFAWRIDETEAWPAYAGYHGVVVAEARAVAIEHGAATGARWHQASGQKPCTGCAPIGDSMSTGVGGVAGADKVGRD